tara:strand:- start:4142 stop:5197 length:1056 start_codon:yes stop_codon:yes gene_type:complete
MRKNRIDKILKEIKSLFIILIIALSLRATIIEAYIVPTGSMENSIMTGDFLIGNKFVFGMRTPDWIGIPYTELGLHIPWARFPHFRRPHNGDIVIFKYPRDNFQKYVKRCVGEPGQNIFVKNKELYVDGKLSPLSENGKFVDNNIFNEELNQPGIFLRKIWNRDNFGPIKIPKVGDTILINESTDWDYLMPLMLMDGHQIVLKGDGIDGEYIFTMKDPNDIARRYVSGLGSIIHGFFSNSKYWPKKVDKLFDKYYNPGNSNGRLLNVWNFKFTDDAFKYLWIDGKPMTSMESYLVKQNYYWMMGDNRDDSADSRYWGFVPEKLILGEAVVVYMSWEFGKGPRFQRIGKIIS